MAFPIQNASIILLVFSCGFFAIMVGISNLFISQRTRLNTLSALTHFAFGSFQMLFALSNSVVTARFSRTVNLISLISFVLYIFYSGSFYCRLFRVEYDNRNKITWFSAIGLIVFCVAITILKSLFENDEFLAGHGGILPSVNILWFLVLLLSFVYVIYLLWELRILLDPEFIAEGFPAKIFYRLAAIGSIVLAVNAATFLSGQKAGNRVLLYSLLYYNAVFAFMFVFSLRCPGFFNISHKNNDRRKYSNSKIHGINVDQIITKLHKLMDDEKIYLDESLSLQKLGNMLGLNSHQLSEILNSELRMNYNSFINSYRISSAKEMLVTHRDWTILAIALHCGFNSKTTFNKVFASSVAMTPSEYRSRN